MIASYKCRFGEFKNNVILLLSVLVQSGVVDRKVDLLILIPYST